MAFFRNSNVTRSVLAFAVMLSLLLAPVMDHGVSDAQASHSQTSHSHEETVSAGFDSYDHVPGAAPGQNQSDNGQWHSHDWPSESHGGHSHGHNPLDHSHDQPAQAELAGQPLPAPERSWRRAVPVSLIPAPSLGIERPPRT